MKQNEHSRIFLDEALYSKITVTKTTAATTVQFLTAGFSKWRTRPNFLAKTFHIF